MITLHQQSKWLFRMIINDSWPDLLKQTETIGTVDLQLNFDLRFTVSEKDNVHPMLVLSGYRVKHNFPWVNFFFWWLQFWVFFGTLSWPCLGRFGNCIERPSWRPGWRSRWKEYWIFRSVRYSEKWKQPDCWSLNLSDIQPLPTLLSSFSS